MPVKGAVEMSVKIPVSAGLLKRWERFTRERGYGKGPFLRAFIEAVTDPARGPEIERIMRERPATKEVRV